MKKIYLIPTIPFIIGIIFFIIYSLIGSHVAPDGTLVEQFGLMYLGWLFAVVGVILGIILNIWLWWYKKLNTIQKVITVLASVLLIAFTVLVIFGIIHNIKVNNIITTTETINVETDTVKDATYLVEGQPINLVKGTSEISIPNSISKQITRYFGNEATGDLNGDGREDMAFILTQDGGGSGTFYYITVALANDNGYYGLNSILLGDRIAPQTIIISEGIINVNYADRELGESFDVEPSVGVSKYFQVIDSKLKEINMP